MASAAVIVGPTIRATVLRGPCAAPAKALLRGGTAEAGMMAVHARLCDRLRLSFKRSST
jgi:hypothetical protein